jgi:hypothetical protein
MHTEEIPISAKTFQALRRIYDERVERGRESRRFDAFVDYIVRTGLKFFGRRRGPGKSGNSRL